MDEPIEQRRQQAVEQITGDISLTENMTDEQAAQVLQWGTRAASWLALQTLDMEEAAAQATLEEKLAHLRRIVRRLDKLVAELPDAGQDEIAERLGQIFDPVSELPELHCEVPADLNQLASRLAPMTTDEALSIMLTILSGEITTV